MTATTPAGANTPRTRPASAVSVAPPAATATHVETPRAAAASAAVASATTTDAGTGEATVHNLNQLVVGDLVLQVEPPSDRKTIEIVVERDASLTLKAPPTATVHRAEQFVKAKRQWIYRKLTDKDALTGPPVTKQFVEGEGFAYLGRNYRLTLSTEPTTGVRLQEGRFHLSVAQAHEGASLMRSWYADIGGQWLQRRVRPWAARLGEQHVHVEVRDLGYRWGSARPTNGPQRINLHWATLQLAPTLIDYVLVHELAHLREINHTPAFWSTVARLMPTYAQQKSVLDTVGRTIWLDASV